MTNNNSSTTGPEWVGHLLRLPLTGGKYVLIDPEEITEMSPHRKQEHVTVVRMRDGKHFVALDMATVENWCFGYRRRDHDGEKQQSGS